MTNSDVASHLICRCRAFPWPHAFLLAEACQWEYERLNRDQYARDDWLSKNLRVERKDEDD